VTSLYMGDFDWLCLKKHGKIYGRTWKEIRTWNVNYADDWAKFLGRQAEKKEQKKTAKR